MRPRLLELLRCPACAGELSVEVWQSGCDEMLEGLLSCACGETFPLIAGVPRMLVGTGRSELPREYPEFFAEHKHRLGAPWLGGQGVRGTQTAERTRRSFGYEWTQFSGMRPEWEANFRGYMAPHDSRYLEGKTVLDAGCGMGRHLYYSGREAGDVVGVDFSRAVDAARANTRGIPNAHVVQADLMQLPFAPETFNFVYSFGVLHHLPEPEQALPRLIDLVKPGGETRIFLYWDIGDAALWKRALLRAVNATRRLTVRLPHPLLHALCYPVAALAWGLFVAPYLGLSRRKATRAFAETLPLKQYARYPFSVLVNDQFDRFSAPLERRYSPDEVREWLGEVGLESVTVQPYFGWLGHGRKPRPRGGDAPAASAAAWGRQAPRELKPSEAL